MTIVQPRIDNLSEYELSVSELMQWTDETLRPAAKAAYDGKGPQHPGEWCQFCKVKSSCRALANQCTQMAEDYAGKILTAEELAKDVLPRLATVKTWLAGIEDYALQQALAGVELPGWKLVEGRSVRKITDQDGAAAALNKAGYKTAEIYTPQELKTITDITEQSYAIRDMVLGKMAALRAVADEAETHTSEKYWPFPTYGELLFGVR